jgi:hypothetical protein
MAIPIAVAGAEQSLGVFQPVAEFAYTGAPFSVNLKDNGSFDPDGGIIVAWQWTLLYKPPGSSASLLNPTTATPTLQNVDVEGTYRVFLEVTDDNVPSEDSEPDKNLAPDSAFCKVVHKTQYHDWRIPASTERNWADIVYVMWLGIDALLPSTSQWDVTHQLFFTTGNTAQIRDNRTAGSKSGEAGLWINSTTGVNTATGEYIGIQVTPGRQLGGGDATIGVNIASQESDIGFRSLDAWRGLGFVARWDADPAVLTTPQTALRFHQTHANLDGGTMLDFQHDDAQKIGSSVVIKGGKATTGTWGGTDPIWPVSYTKYDFGSSRLFLTELTFEHRIAASTYQYGGAFGDADGTIKWFIDVENLTTPAIQQDIVLMRVVRQEPIADNNGKDFGVMWRESTAELAAPPADPGSYPAQTLLMRRPDTAEWSFMGVQRARVAAPSTPVPFERPGWIQGTASVNPPSDGIDEWTFDVTLPSTVSVDLSEGGSWSDGRMERVIAEWSLKESDFVVTTNPVVAPSNGIRVKIKYAQPFATTSGQGTFTQTTPSNGIAYRKQVVLPTPLKVGPAWATTLSIQLIPYMNGTFGTDIPIMAVDTVTVNGSNFLTDFWYYVQPREDDHPVPTSMTFFYQIQVEKLFYITDSADFHWAAMVTVAV